MFFDNGINDLERLGSLLCGSHKGQVSTIISMSALGKIRMADKF